MHRAVILLLITLLPALPAPAQQLIAHLVEDDRATSGQVVYDLMLVHNVVREPIESLRLRVDWFDDHLVLESAQPAPMADMQFDELTTETIRLHPEMLSLNVRMEAGHPDNANAGRFLRVSMLRKDDREATPRVFIDQHSSRDSPIVLQGGTPLMGRFPNEAPKPPPKPPPPIPAGNEFIGP